MIHHKKNDLLKKRRKKERKKKEEKKKKKKTQIRAGIKQTKSACFTQQLKRSVVEEYVWKISTTLLKECERRKEVAIFFLLPFSVFDIKFKDLPHLCCLCA